MGSDPDSHKQPTPQATRTADRSADSSTDLTQPNGTYAKILDRVTVIEGWSGTDTP